MQHKKAFSTLEVLASVGVILLLAAIVVPSYRATNEGAKESSALRNVSTLNSAASEKIRTAHTHKRII